MKPVSEYSTIRPGVFFWQGYETEVKCDCSSSAVVTPAGVIFIDPIPLAEEALRDLVVESESSPSAVLLTSGNHQRESLAFARRFGIPIFAPKDAGEEIVADQRFVSGEGVAGMKAITLSGFGPGETAFSFEDILIFGDALINLEPEGMRLLPEKYRTDKKQSLRSLSALQLLAPEILLFAHGTPVLQRASERLACLIAESDGISCRHAGAKGGK